MSSLLFKLKQNSNNNNKKNSRNFFLRIMEEPHTEAGDQGSGFHSPATPFYASRDSERRSRSEPASAEEGKFTGSVLLLMR
jgi:hypothetical protein